MEIMTAPTSGGSGDGGDRGRALADEDRLRLYKKPDFNNMKDL